MRANSSCWRRPAWRCRRRAPRTRRHDLLGAARPLVASRPHFGADAELEGVEAVLVAQPTEPRRLVFRRDVALHRGRIGPELPGRAAEQRTTGFPSSLPRRSHIAVSRPRSRGTDSCPGTCARAPKMSKALDVECIAAEHQGATCRWKICGGDVGVVGRRPAPSLARRLGGQPHEADEGRWRRSRSRVIFIADPSQSTLRTGLVGADTVHSRLIRDGPFHRDPLPKSPRRGGPMAKHPEARCSPRSDRPAPAARRLGCSLPGPCASSSCRRDAAGRPLPATGRWRSELGHLPHHGRRCLRATRRRRPDRLARGGGYLSSATRCAAPIGRAAGPPHSGPPGSPGCRRRARCVGASAPRTSFRTSRAHSLPRCRPSMPSRWRSGRG